MEDLENARCAGRIEYPANLADALFLLDNWKGASRHVASLTNDTEAMSFATAGTEGRGGDRGR